MGLISVAWDNYRKSRVIPIFLLTALVGSFTMLLFVKGAEMLTEGSLLSVALSFISFCFATALLFEWWSKVKELYTKPADNMLLTVTAAVIISVGAYVEYGPHGEHVGSFIATISAYTLDHIASGFGISNAFDTL